MNSEYDRAVDELNEASRLMSEAFGMFGRTCAETHEGLVRMIEMLDEIEPIDLRKVGKMRAGMMLEDYGSFALLMPTFWRWIWMWWRG